MGIYSCDSEVKTSISRERMFKAYCLDADNIIPKVAPHDVKNSEILEGDGGPGTIKKITFAEGMQLKTMKHKIEYIDKENYSYCYSVIEGEALMEKFEKITYETKFLGTPDGGCIAKTTTKYFVKAEAHFSEEHIRPHREKHHALFRALEAHLVAHPRECI